MTKLAKTVPINDDYIEYIIDTYSDLVYKLAYAQTRNKNDADDIYQEVFLRLVRKKPVFHDTEHEKAWLIRVTVNCCNSFWRSASRWHPQEIEALEVEPMPEADDLRYLLDQLPQKYRAVIHLFYYEDMPTAQISAVLGIKEPTVRVQLNRARQMLKDIITEGEENYVKASI